MPRNIPPHITRNLLVNFCKFVISSKAIDLELTDQEWGMLYYQFKKGKPTAQVYGIVYLNWKVATFFGLNPEDLLRSIVKSQSDRVVRPRQVAIYFMREFGFSSEVIRKYYDFENHSVVVHSYKTVKTDMSTDPKFKEKVEQLTKQLMK